MPAVPAERDSAATPAPRGSMSCLGAIDWRSEVRRSALLLTHATMRMRIRVL